MSTMIQTASEFRPAMPVPYPTYQAGKNIEEYFYDYFISEGNTFLSERIYLPIFWTGYYTEKDVKQQSSYELQTFLDSLDRTKKYFSVLHFYDKGITNNIHGLDLLVFSSNHPQGIPIPLLSNIPVTPHIKHKTVLASFYGQPNGTLRHAMIARLADHKGFDVSFQSIPAFKYFNILEESNFTLAPAGYGPTSFRLYEALYFNSIPIYIYDRARWLPYENLIDWSKLAILVRKERVALIPIILKNYPISRQKEMKEYYKTVWEKYFTLEGICNYVKQQLNDEKKAV